MKAFGYVMFVDEYPDLEIERKVGLRYKSDLVAISGNGGFDFWASAGSIPSAKQTGCFATRTPDEWCSLRSEDPSTNWWRS
jgi:hypothetical protein